MPPEPDNPPVVDETLRTYALTQGEYEVKFLSLGELCFQCVRCWLRFARGDFGTNDQMIAALKDHAASHARPTARAKAYQQAREARRRAIDAAAGPTQAVFALDGEPE